jgi:hypothetical protein
MGNVRRCWKRKRNVVVCVLFALSFFVEILGDLFEQFFWWVGSKITSVRVFSQIWIHCENPRWGNELVNDDIKKLLISTTIVP